MPVERIHHLLLWVHDNIWLLMLQIQIIVALLIGRSKWIGEGRDSTFQGYWVYDIIC